MIRVRFTRFEFDAAAQRWAAEPVAELLADGDQVTVSGPHAEWIGLDIPVIDPETGGRLTRQADAERWARLLPLAYRSGDLDLEVDEVEVANPLPAAFHYAG
jgi:hypothetical protein